MATALWQWFRERNIAGTEIAAKTGYALNHVYALLNGRYPMNKSAMFRLMAIFPDLPLALLENGTEEENHERCISESIR